MKRNTLIEHKEVVVCEESEHVSMSYNALLATLKVNARVKPILPIVTSKSTFTSTNCGKISHLVETCHIKKKDVPIVPSTIVKFTKHVARTKAQPIRSKKVHVHYPYIIFCNIEHRL